MQFVRKSKDYCQLDRLSCNQRASTLKKWISTTTTRAIAVTVGKAQARMLMIPTMKMADTQDLAEVYSAPTSKFSRQLASKWLAPECGLLLATKRKKKINKKEREREQLERKTNCEFFLHLAIPF